MIKNFLISVVIPTFNSEKFIIQTLESVTNQTMLPGQLIVSDDGSSDNTVKIVKQFFKDVDNLDTLLIQNDHKGAGATRNAGIVHSKYDWISFLDSDDRWYPEKIMVMNNTINKNPNVNFIFHNEDRKKLNGEIELLHNFESFFNSKETLIKQLWRYCIFHTSAITVKKKLLIEKGLFNESLLSSQDWELWIRLAPSIKYTHINQTLGIYIDRENNITNTKSFRGLIDRLRVMSIHWRISKVSIWEYIYMAFRRIIGFIFAKAKTIK